MPEPTDRNVYLLGAGFSQPAGAPLIYDFLERSREFLNNPPPALDDHGLEQFRRVFEFKDAMAKAREKISVDLDNIEHLFGLVEMSGRLGTTPIETRNSTIYLIAKTLELCTTPRRPRGHIGFEMERERAESASFKGEEFAKFEFQPTGNPRCTVDLYDFFALLLGGATDDSGARANRKDVVITFNYDLVLDDALLRAHLIPSYGHGPEEEVRPNAVPVLKLHGSTNWAVCPGCAKPLVFTEKITRSFSELTTIPCPECGENKYRPLLIPPSWDKTGHRDTMQPIWKAAVNELRRATRICIIGYSMPESDAFFRYLLTIALADNRQLERLIVVDYSGPQRIDPQGSLPRRNAVGEKWSELLDPTFQKRRFTFHDDGFAQWLTQYARQEMRRGDNVLSLHSYGG